MAVIRVLIVDDDYASRLLIQKILAKENYECILCAEAKMAIKTLRENPVDLVISDLVMSEMNGIELLKQVKIIDPTFPVIILTGHASLQTAVESLRQGAVDYLLKPINADELIIRVKKGLENTRIQKRLAEIERQLTYTATVTTANHEINQPLTVILSAVDMIRMEFDRTGIDEPKISNYMNLIEKSSQRIAGILRNLREISSPVIQKIPLGMQLIELNARARKKTALEKYILVIEDEEQIRVLIKDMLEAAGYKIILSSNAHEGLEIFKNQHHLIDLVLLDYYLPDNNGKEVMKELKQFDPNSKILLTSGFELNEEIQQAIDQGAVGFLSKPFNREQIVKFIQHVVS